jgi:hypothetical protein
VISRFISNSEVLENKRLRGGAPHGSGGTGI